MSELHTKWGKMTGGATLDRSISYPAGGLTAFSTRL
jgi:hypothetical protein